MNVSSFSSLARNARVFIAMLAVLTAVSIGRPCAIAQVPDSPAPQTTPSKQQSDNGNQKKQTKRILGVIPNFRAVSSGATVPPLTVKQKLLLATHSSFDYSAIFTPALLAGLGMASDATPEFGQGAAGYGRYFWHAALDQTIKNYMVQFAVPAISRQDPRYYTLGQGKVLRRTEYALSRILITRSDSGKEQFNVSQVMGSGAAAALSTTYYPSSQQNFARVGRIWGVNLGTDGIGFVLKEFWPDIHNRFFHGSRPNGSSLLQPQE